MGYIVAGVSCLPEFPVVPPEPWAEGDLPHSRTVDLDEFPSALKDLRKCRSFRADMRHKLEIIVRAHGGYGSGGMRHAARRLGVHRHTFRRWFQWKAVPATRSVYARIDDAYDRALEVLAARKTAKRVR